MKRRLRYAVPPTCKYKSNAPFGEVSASQTQTKCEWMPISPTHPHHLNTHTHAQCLQHRPVSRSQIVQTVNESSLLGLSCSLLLCRLKTEHFIELKLKLLHFQSTSVISWFWSPLHLPHQVRRKTPLNVLLALSVSVLKFNVTERCCCISTTHNVC